MSQPKPPSPPHPGHPVLPDFLLAGAAKCGTTSLYQYLRQHPDVFMSPVKEPQFLSGVAANPGTGPGDAARTHQGITRFDRYAGLFEKGGQAKAVGEASPETLFHHDRAIPAIQRFLGSPRILIILRNPVDRAYSNYNSLVREGWETASFEEALNLEQQRSRAGYRFSWLYTEVGRYAGQVKAFLKHFDRVRVMLLDDLQSNPAGIMADLYDFLGVDASFAPDLSIRHNPGGIPRFPLLDSLFVRPKKLHRMARAAGCFLVGDRRWTRLRDGLRCAFMDPPAPMRPETGTRLATVFREDILRLQDLIDRDLGMWLAERRS